MTPPLRQPTAPAVHASPAADPITWAAVRRTVIGASVVGAFLGFIGAFGTLHIPFLLRMVYMLPISWAGALLGLLTFRLTCRLLPQFNGRRWLQGLICGVIMTPPMTLVAWAIPHITPHGGDPISALPGYSLVTLVSCLGFSSLAVGLNRHAHLLATHASASPTPPPVRFLERLPLKLRGAEVWAVEAEDHYLRLHTSKGQDLILLRLADAVAELEGIEGAQVHRSWWVARDAIADARRGDGRAVLTLKDGSEVPVSRTYARLLREQGWI